MWFEAKDNGKIRICAETQINPDMVFIEPPDGFLPEEMHKWIAVDGAIVPNPDYVEPKVEPTQEERIKALEEALTAIGEGIASV